MNEHLLTINFNDPAAATGTQMTVSAKDHQWFQGSELFQDGLYEFSIMDAKYAPQKEGKAVAIRMTCRVSGPAGCDAIGRRVVHHQGVPCGDPNEDVNVSKARMMADLLISMAEAEGGEAKAAQFRAMDSAALTPAVLKGQRFYATTQTVQITSGKGKVYYTSNITFPSSRADYEASGGPSVGSSIPVTAQATPTVQGAQPNLMGGGGNHQTTSTPATPATDKVGVFFG